MLAKQSCRREGIGNMFKLVDAIALEIMRCVYNTDWKLRSFHCAFAWREHRYRPTYFGTLFELTEPMRLESIGNPICGVGDVRCVLRSVPLRSTTH